MTPRRLRRFQPRGEERIIEPQARVAEGLRHALHALGNILHEIKNVPYGAGGHLESLAIEAVYIIRTG